MPSISISGIGSGIDFNAVRDAIINQRAIPINQLQSKVSRYNSRIDSLKEMNLLLANLTNAANDLTRADLGSGRTATPVDPSVAAVTATSSAGIGPLTVNVTRLASSLSQASKSYASPNSTILVGNGGGGGNNPQSATFQLRKGGAATGPSITINAANNSLAGLRDAINAANAGVTASVVDISGTGTQNQLVLNSTETGASGRVQLVETSSTNTLSSLTIRNLNPSNGTFSDLDATVTINGLAITRPTNDISNAVEGLTISLKKVGSTVVDVTRSEEVEGKLDAFVTAYNAIQDFVAAQYKKDAEGRPSGVLAGDAALRGIQKQVSSIVGITSTNNGGPLRSLADIGITVERTGQLKLDKDVLNEKLTANTNNVLSLLRGKTAAQTGIFQGAYDISFDLSDSITGTVQNAISGYEATIKNLNSTIEKRTALLNNMRDILTRQFAAADAAIGQLNGQGTAIGNLMKTLTANNND
jgi:flagellar hook-associated protein 2